MSTVRLGYEVGTGAPVEIPIAHMVITGQTQLAGKTTALEGLASRAAQPRGEQGPIRALAFATKRGEKAFANARRIQPYFRERADWQFVASVLEAAMRERMKFERAWIMRASKGAKTLADVQRNVRVALADTKTRGLSADVYTQLDAYLDIVVPRLATVDFAPGLELRDFGVCVMDISNSRNFPPELQGLVMRSALEWIYAYEDGVVAMIPEAWEFMPQSRGSPVKLAAVELIRKGAALKNFVWLDSQDIGGVDKELLRSCSVWLLGVQREANEIKRVLGSIPAGTKKPKADEIAKLERGQFFACFGSTVVKAYAQPAWMPDDLAQVVARKECVPPTQVALGVALLDGTDDSDDTEDDEQLPGDVDLDHACAAGRIASHDEQQEEEDDMTPAQEQKLDTVLDLMEKIASAQQARQNGPAQQPIASVREGVATMGAPIDEAALFERFRTRLLKDPKVLAVALAVPIIEVSTTVERIEIDGKTAGGRAALLLRDGFFDAQKGAPEATVEINKRGGNFERITVYKALEELCEKGFLYREQLSNRAVVYTAVEGMRKNIQEKRA